jgi:hypothetical protein
VESAYAQASLQTASLKARSGGTADQINSRASAQFGDSFGAVDSATGQAHNWQANEKVSFNFAITGAVQQSLSSEQMSALDSQFSSMNHFGISVYRPGYISRAARVEELWALPYTDAVALELSVLNAEIDSLRIASNHAWLGRVYTPWFDGSQAPYINIDAQNPTVVSLDFAPGGSFEWTAYLEVMTRFQPSTPLAERPTFVADFSHSIGVSFTGIDGTVTTSTSGYFPDTIAVAAIPEPSTWALMLGGMGLLGWLRKQSPSKRTELA